MDKNLPPKAPTRGRQHRGDGCNRTPNTVSLHVLTALACCASWRLLCVTYAMIARQGRTRCCLSIRLGQHCPHTLRIVSWQESLFIHAAAYART
jgi:hypothetical protein